MRRWNDGNLLIRLTLCACLGVLVASISHNLGNRLPNIHESVANQLAILDGRPTTFYGHEGFFGAWSNRVMFPLALAALVKTGLLSASQWFMVLRCATAILALAVFAWATSKDQVIGWRVEVAGIALVSVDLLASFTEAWEIPSDFLDVAFISLFVWAALHNRRWSLLLLALLSTSNRESAAFAGVIWIAVQGVTGRCIPRWREIGFGVVVCCLAYATVLALRYAVTGPVAVGSQTQTIVAFSGLVTQVHDFLTHLTPIGWPTMLAIIFVLTGGWIAINRDLLRDVDIRLILCAAALFAASLLFANIKEIRPFLPSFTILAYVAVNGEARRSQAEAQRLVPRAPG